MRVNETIGGRTFALHFPDDNLAVDYLPAEAASDWEFEKQFKLRILRFHPPRTYLEAQDVYRVISSELRFSGASRPNNERGNLWTYRKRNEGRKE